MSPPDGSPILIPVSAASKTALKTLCARLAEAVDKNPGALLDIAGTLAVRRSHLDHRLVVVASSAQDMSRALGAFASEETPAGIITGREIERATPCVRIQRTGIPVVGNGAGSAPTRCPLSGSR